MMQFPKALLLILCWMMVLPSVMSFSASSARTTTTTTTNTAAAEWLRGRWTKSNLVEVSVNNNDQLVVTTTQQVKPGQVLFGYPTVWTAASAYKDKDMGPKLRDLYQQAGPGFGVVALSGEVAAERIRRYRKIKGMGTAPESVGYTVPSDVGAYARWLWQTQQQQQQQQQPANKFDESLVETVRVGVQLLVPLLELTARRAWSSMAADETDVPAFLSPEWAQKAMFDDGASTSWSRGELESLALDAFSLVLEHQRPPPPCCKIGVGSLIPAPFVVEEEVPDHWPDGETLALIPFVQEFLSTDGTMNCNAILGSPPTTTKNEEKDCLWCVATEEIPSGTRIVAANPWD